MASPVLSPIRSGPVHLHWGPGKSVSVGVARSFCEVSLGTTWRGGMWVDGVFRGPRSVFCLRRWRHAASARLHITDAQGSLPRELVLRPPEPKPDSPIPRSPSPRSGSTSQPSGPGSNQTAFQPGTQSAFKPGIIRQPSSSATCQLSNPA